MKAHYDFSKAVVGKYYRPIDQLEMPVYLDPQVRNDLAKLAGTSGQDLTTLINELLKKDLELISHATMPAIRS
jgi:formate dehydrogenase maturation protein FdhE